MSDLPTSDARVVPFRRDVRDLLSRKLLEAVEMVLEEELADVLGTHRYERQEQRRDYRNGKQLRSITTSIGAGAGAVSITMTAPRRNFAAICCLGTLAAHEKWTRPSLGSTWRVATAGRLYSCRSTTCVEPES